MNTKVINSIVGGIAGTVVMTAIMMIAPMMGMPKMSPPKMLAGMMGFPVFVGWMMHFMIGIIFSAKYYFLIKDHLKIENKYLKGAVFGLGVFVFAQIMMAIMGAMFLMPKPAGSMILMMIGSVMGHAIYGMVVAGIEKK